MADPAAFAKFVPGLDFLQGLLKQGAASAPAMSQWIAPTLDPAEIDKRIDELRTVQFWLEQNARLIGASIQALEVQRMTLATLQSMNMPLAALRDAMTLTPPPAAPSFGSSRTAPAPAAAPARFPTRAAERDDRDQAEQAEDEADDEADLADATDESGPQAAAARRASPAPDAGAKGSAATAVGIDPMQWWGALTQQFGELATRAMRDAPALGAAAGMAAAAHTRAEGAGKAAAGAQAAKPARGRGGAGKQGKGSKAEKAGKARGRAARAAPQRRR
ncbi:MAG: hypothetical protein HYZ20_13580 [Burkholderiales bacterium]|nr:hypothetical protein [Burkholderiales bacterium]